MFNSKRRPAAAATIAIASMGLFAAPTQASPPSGISVETYVTGTLMGSDQENSDRIKFQTKAQCN